MKRWLPALTTSVLALVLVAAYASAPVWMPAVSEWANRSSFGAYGLVSGVAWCSVSVRQMEVDGVCYPAARLRKWLP